MNPATNAEHDLRPGFDIQYAIVNRRKGEIMALHSARQLK